MPAMTDGQIVVSGLTKQYERSGRWTTCRSPSSRAGSPASSARTGPARRPPCACCLNLVTPDRRHRDHRRAPVRRPDQPLRHVGAVLEASSAHKGRTGRNHLRVICAAAGLPAAPRRRGARAGRADPGRQAQVQGLLAGHAPAARHRRRACSATRGCWSWTSRPTGWTRRASAGCATCSRRSPSEGRTVLVSSHLLSEMQLLADDVVIIAAGKLVTQGPVEQVVSVAHAAQVRVRTPGAGRSSSPSSAPPPRVTGPTTARCWSPGWRRPAVGAAALRAGVELHELVTERPTWNGSSWTDRRKGGASDDELVRSEFMQDPHHEHLVAVRAGRLGPAGAGVPRSTRCSLHVLLAEPLDRR